MGEHDYSSAFAQEADTRFADIRAARERRRAVREAVFEAPTLGYEEKERPKGAFARVLLTQAVIFALLLGGLLLAQRAAPNTYRQLRTAYTKAMQVDLTAKQVWARVREAFLSLKEDVYVVAPPSAAHEQTTAPYNYKAEQVDGAEATDAPPGVTEGMNGMGGADIAAAEATAAEIAALFAKRKAGYAPLRITVPPIPPVRVGRLTSPYGLRTHPITGGKSIHTGLDIGAEEGAPILAAFFGRVAKVGEDADYGKYILLAHAGGMQTFYAHCSEVLAQEGMVLRAGETVALVGSTGLSTGPHLHFEIRLNGLRCDPAPFLAQYYSQ
ncbi:MAG: M23 family metallopeptidase [Oscillospiraceae bacterium]|jgi:murein DD-endopeptidase MepM/ murein hydrolase activator NlpD|nr:M23 family metallopeptidase [Oscillospiraceae bacterium]